MRRIVTGRGVDGRDAILRQDSLKPIAGMPGSRNETRLCWSTSGRIVLPHVGGDPVAKGEMVPPGPGDSRFLFVTFPAGSVTPIHATPTSDYVVVVAGELWLVMENGEESRLAAGDCVVQNGTRHAWDNRSAEPCTIAAVMIGAEHL